MTATTRTNPAYASEIHERLQAIRAMRRRVGVPYSVDCVLRFGRPFEDVATTPQSLPWTRKEGQCFSNCAQLAFVGSPDLTYVEGYAMIADTGVTVHRAWCVDAQGRVHDPTWRQPGDAYFGVPFVSAYLRARYDSQASFGLTGSLFEVGDDDYTLVRGLVDPSVWMHHG